TAFAGGARWLDRWCDSRVAKFSGHTSQGIMKVTAIFALFGHSIGAGRGTVALGLFPAAVLGFSRNAGKSLPGPLRCRLGQGAGTTLLHGKVSRAPCPRGHVLPAETRGHGAAPCNWIGFDLRSAPLPTLRRAAILQSDVMAPRSCAAARRCAAGSCYRHA